jgi:hypothetical protein
MRVYVTAFLALSPALALAHGPDGHHPAPASPAAPAPPALPATYPELMTELAAKAGSARTEMGASPTSALPTARRMADLVGVLPARAASLPAAAKLDAETRAADLKQKLVELQVALSKGDAAASTAALTAIDAHVTALEAHAK